VAKVLLKRSKRVSDGSCRFCREKGIMRVFTEGGVWPVCLVCYKKRQLWLDTLEETYWEG